MRKRKNIIKDKKRPLSIVISGKLLAVLVIGLFLEGFFFSSVPAMALTHPCLMFDNINQTPGYQNRTTSPWSTWEAVILANSAVHYEALAYQISGNTAKAASVRTKLLALDTTGGIAGIWRLQDHILAYDWVQTYLSAADDTTIRDRLATLADNCYQTVLTIYGPSYISFADYHGQAYPVMGMAGCGLEDYTNPNGLPLSSTPADWKKVGTDYLFVYDALHSYPGKSLIDHVIDTAGKYTAAAYKNYWIEEFIWWFQTYSHFFGQNIFNVYPKARKIMSSELWDVMPNRYDTNYGTGGNYRWDYHKGILNLFDAEYKGYMLNYNKIVMADTTLPHTRTFGSLPLVLLYLTWPGEGGITPQNPSWTSHFNQGSFFQVFRENWNKDSDWLSFITWPSGLACPSNREMMHNDQLSFEYYSRGDLLLADSGEPKHVEFATQLMYGEPQTFHNTILIEDPRTPFPLSSWDDSPSRGMYKGLGGEVTTPASWENLIQTAWIDLLEAKAAIRKVGDYPDTNILSSPIDYKRAILYPRGEYFIVIDRFEGTQTWRYRNLFRFSSLDISPTTGAAPPYTVGRVYGDLTIGGGPYNWEAIPYTQKAAPPNDEVTTGLNTSSIKWNATNPNGYRQPVKLHLYSVPSADILVTKYITRIAGYNGPSEVCLPLVYFRSGESTSLYRATVLLSRYTAEVEKTPSTLAVTGTGNALKVISTSPAYEDLIYTGKGSSSFDGVATNADILYLRRNTAEPLNLTFIRGSSVTDGGRTLFSLSSSVDYLSSNQVGSNLTFVVKGSGTINLRFQGKSVTSVTQDGAPITFTKETQTILISPTLTGTHTFVVNGWFNVEPPTDTSEDGEKAKLIVTPNPYVKGKSLGEIITFGNLRKESTIRIYTVSGDLIKTIEHRDAGDGGSEEWDLSDIASGVYIYYIESSGREMRGKVTIIK